MKRVTLKYKFKSETADLNCPPYKGNIPRPVIPVRLGYGTKFTPFFDALLDTGADISMFWTEIAEFLGIDWHSCRSVSFNGAGGQPAPGYIHKVKVDVGGYIYGTEVAFVPKDKLARPALLGQHGFFEGVECSFDRRNGGIRIAFDYNEKEGTIALPD